MYKIHCRRESRRSLGDRYACTIHHTYTNQPASIRCFVWLARDLQTRLWCRDTCKHLLNGRYKYIDPLATRLAPDRPSKTPVYHSKGTRPAIYYNSVANYRLITMHYTCTMIIRVQVQFSLIPLEEAFCVRARVCGCDRTTCLYFYYKCYVDTV